MGKSNTGIACSAFYDTATGPKLATGFCCQYYEFGGAILDGATRVQEFGLTENLTARLLTHAFEAYQRRVADRIDETVVVVQIARLIRPAILAAARSGYRVSAISNHPDNVSSLPRLKRTAR